MDVFIEKIIKKQKGFKEYSLIAGTIILVIAITFALTFVKFFQSILFLVVIALVYGAWILIGNLNTEYEYIVTNDEIDIDIIINRKKRKRLFSTSCKDFDILANVKSENFNDEVRSIENKIIACSSLQSPNLYYATLEYKGQKTLLYFEPDERILNALKVFIPKKVFI